MSCAQAPGAVSAPAPAAFGHEFAQMLEQFVGGAPYMENDRQAVLARQFELLAVEILLARSHGALHQLRYKIIESDFSHRDQARV